MSKQSAVIQLQSQWFSKSVQETLNAHISGSRRTSQDIPRVVLQCGIVKYNEVYYIIVKVEQMLGPNKCYGQTNKCTFVMSKILHFWGSNKCHFFVGTNKCRSALTLIRAKAFQANVDSGFLDPDFSPLFLGPML